MGYIFRKNRFEYYEGDDVPLFIQDQNPEKPGVISLLKKTVYSFNLILYVYSHPITCCTK